ncbi:MAG: DUF357 domain-containing protein [Nanoarchaeota archaeon]|nr:DUF357 domain-containing protein [Nanoarchaeota archaeon]MBU0963242.1 DUF357 domain-containing protein [Nanoarchaeota archaeon]
MKEITEEKLNKYIKLTEKAIKELENVNNKDALILINMSKNYYKDALHFKEKNDFVNAFAAINYAHAFLDSAALLKLIKVKDNKLFMVD